MTTNQVIAIAEVLAVLVGGVAIYMTLRGLRAQLWLQTFAEYTRRYSEIVDVLPAESRRPEGDFELESLDKGKRDQVLNAVRAYLNLCSEEYYLQGKRRIDQETWRIWRAGIQETARLPWIQETWNQIRSEYSFYPGFCRFMDECVAAEVAAPEVEQA